MERGEEGRTDKPPPPKKNKKKTTTKKKPTDGQTGGTMRMNRTKAEGRTDGRIIIYIETDIRKAEDGWKKGTNKSSNQN